MPEVTECVSFRGLQQDDILLTPMGFYVGIILKIARDGMWIDKTPERLYGRGLRLVGWIPRREKGVAVFEEKKTEVRGKA